MTSKIDANHAKNGCENWFVMVNVPSSLDICNKESIAKLKKAVINMMSSHLAENIEDVRFLVFSWGGPLYRKAP